MSLANPLRPVTGFLDRLTGQGRKRRRTWVGNGRAHIEVRGLRGPGAQRLAVAVEAALKRLKGVHWAEVAPLVGRVIVAFDGETVSVDDILDVVGSVEEEYDVDQERFPHELPEHPGDVEPMRRNLAALGADVVGLGISGFGQLLRTTPIPAEVASVLSLFDTQPRLRRIVEANLGQAATDLGLALTSAIAQAFSQGPLSLIVDATHRANLIGEIYAERQSWIRREPELFGQPHERRLRLTDVGKRPGPLPAGPVETYADRISLASVAGFGLAMAATRDPRRAANVVLAALPKAAQQGRNAFAAQLGRSFAGRGAVVMDRSVLRRLDRIDTVVVDARAVVTGRAEVSELLPFGNLDVVELGRQVGSLFDPGAPEATHRRGGWAVGPLGALEVEVPPVAEAAVRRLRAGRSLVLGIARKGELVGLARAGAELDPLAGTLADRIRAGHFTLVVAGSTGNVAARLGAERTVAGAGRLAASVRQLQSEGRGVGLIAAYAHAGLVAADCGIGLIVPGQHPPGGADVMCGPGLEQVCFLIEAAGRAREVSRLSAQFAVAGSAVGGVLATVGTGVGAANRALVPVNGAALAAQAAGTLAAVSLARRPPPALPAEQPPWHELDVSEVVAALGSSREGLASTEAARRRTRPEPLKRQSNLPRLVASELVNPLTPVLALGASLAAAVGSVTDAALVGGVVVANAAVSGTQRLRTERSLQRLLRLSATTASAFRDGSLVEVPAADLVPGDVIDVGPGDVVPADCRIIITSGCEVDESSLTGESLPVRKGAAPAPTAILAERRCMLYEGTTMLTGGATAVVVAIGGATEAGRGLAGAIDAPPSGVEARLQRLTAISVPATIVSGAAVAAAGIVRGRPVRDAVGSGVSVLVAAVPEGLPLLATVAQQGAAHRLSQRGALVRNPRTIEALGRVDLLCFDKTGTLTQGRIGLQRVSDGVRDEPLDALGPVGRNVLAAALRASPNSDEGDDLPHATDRAVVEGAAAAGVSVTECVGTWSPLAAIAFEPGRGFHAVLGRTSSDKRVVAKGAPEVILSRCRSWRHAEGGRPLDRRNRRRLDAEANRLARQGLRILAVAEAAAGDAAELVDSDLADLEFVGFVALADLVRPTAATAVDSVRRAGVDVAMVTGDHPSTAEAVATDLGILNGGKVLAGPELDRVPDAELDAALAGTTVFARITPTQKVRIVEAYQRAGRVVAMTGDGANDAAAIRLADAGVALGRRGTPTAREAADLVVTDDRIETIVDAIVEGRAMWTSVRDALAILIGGNLGEVGFVLAGSVLTGSSPLTPRQLLLVNLLTDLMPAMAIALRPPPGVDPEALLREGPDASLGATLARDVAIRALATAGGATGAWLAARATGPAVRARTVGLVALVGTQLGQTALLGAPSPLILGVSAVSAGVLVAIIQTPGISQFFGCTPLDPIGWTTALSSASIATAATVAGPWAAGYLERQLRRTRWVDLRT